VKFDVDGILLVVNMGRPVDVDFKVNGWVWEVKVLENEVRKFQT
jgi:hypothetical protein